MNPRPENTASLFSSYQLRSTRLRNRIIASPLEKNLSDHSGAPTELYVDYVRARARGGVGLIIPEASYIHPFGRGSTHQLGAHDDRLVPSLRRLVDAAHPEGAAIAMQINFSSRQTASSVTGFQPWSASGIPCGAHAVAEPLHVMTRDDIAWVRGLFAAAAQRVKSAGFDAVILHGAHGYLLSEFFSPRSNRREDEYGGSLENRARLALEAVRAVREAVGEDYIVGYRLSADECVPGGFTIEDSLWLAGELERAGVDWIDVSMGVYESGWRLTPLADAPTAANAEAAARIRKTVSIPISVVGRIVDPEVAKSVIASGAADFVTIGRALHADPDFARKASGEDSAPLRPCVSCMVCVDCRNENIPAVCSVNPMSGRATPARRKTANPRRRVAVVGGGLAGLQAAERAAEHGNDVVLFEAAEDLGGQLLWAARLPFMTDYSRIVAYFRRRLAELRVDIHLGSKADVETMRAVAPHAVVMATGAAPWIPAIPGLRERSCDTVATFDSERVSGPVMIIGGSIAGLAVGLAAARRGVAVDLVEQGSVWGFGGGAMLTSRLVEELKAIRAVTLRLATTVERIGVDGVELQNGGRRWIAPPAAHVVVARQMQSETRFADVYAGSAHGAPVFRAGDCVWPRRMADAVFEGASVVERWMAEA